MIIGYTTGVFDLFHIGHVNILRNAKSMCDKLIVGVSTDELAKYKNKIPIIPFHERIEVVNSCRYVDVTIPQKDMDKFKIWQKIKFNLLFVGDDWYESDKWKNIETKLESVGVKTIFYPYTEGVSSTLINKTLNQLRKDL